ncbi:GTPase [Mycoplasmatota bacterium WC44]
MRKIIIIGCPGSGKSTLSKELRDILRYPLLHLDKIYHISNTEHITRDELKAQINEFDKKHENWIIDGNYLSTMEFRIQLADTIILFNIDTNICLDNVINRAKMYKGKSRSDMAEGFTENLEEEFLDFVRSFRSDIMPEIDKLISKYDKKVIRINNYQEKKQFLSNMI